MYLIPCSLPPSCANRLLLSLAMRDCNPNLTNDVFSLIPVKSDAFLRIASSISNVVLMVHPPHAYKYASNRHTNQAFSIHDIPKIGHAACPRKAITYQSPKTRGPSQTIGWPSLSDSGSVIYHPLSSRLPPFPKSNSHRLGCGRFRRRGCNGMSRSNREYRLSGFPRPYSFPLLIPSWR